MKVFISAQIRRKEFGRKVPAEDLPVISRSARAALGVTIAARGLPPHTHLIKAYATSKRGPKRIVYLLLVEGGDTFLLFYRGKMILSGVMSAWQTRLSERRWKSISRCSKRIFQVETSRSFCPIKRRAPIEEWQGRRDDCLRWRDE